MRLCQFLFKFCMFRWLVHLRDFLCLPVNNTSSDSSGICRLVRTYNVHQISPLNTVLPLLKTLSSLGGDKS